MRWQFLRLPKSMVAYREVLLTTGKSAVVFIDNEGAYVLLGSDGQPLNPMFEHSHSGLGIIYNHPRGYIVSYDKRRGLRQENYAGYIDASAVKSIGIIFDRIYDFIPPVVESQLLNYGLD